MTEAAHAVIGVLLRGAGLNRVYACHGRRESGVRPGRPDDADLCGHNAAVLSVQLRPIRLVNYATLAIKLPIVQ